MNDVEGMDFFEIFPWDNNFKTGIEQIDEEHKQLVDILNRLAAHLANRSHPATLNKYFDELADYASYHFRSEEGVWNRYLKGDEWLAEHQRTHVSFVDDVLALRQEEGEKPLDDVLQDVVTFLSKWLAFHILDNDKRMAKVVLAIESGASVEEAKNRANEEMSGSTQLFIQTVLSMYERLTMRTMDIMREKSLRKAAEASLLKAKEEAEQANRSKSMFLAHMSHEIRTPMNAIIGMAHMVMQMQLSEKQLDCVAKIHHSAENLMRIINETLDFSRIESGKMELETADFELQGVIDNLLFIADTNASTKGVRISLDIDENIPAMLRGDALRLGQVLINLAGNAIKFSPDGGSVVIRGRLLEQADQAIQLQFSVQDSGIGMTPEQQQKLFRSFAQADVSTARAYGGSGLGLLISKMIVEMMGGRIWLESALNEGSTFYFTVKLGQPLHDRGQMAEQAALDDIEAAKESLRGAKILLVEDDVINQEIALELLASLDMSVELATNGEEALALLVSDRFDGVLMDCQMPVMDGYEATRRIRQQEQLQSLPVLAMSADEMESGQDLIRESGMNDLIPKPINISQMWLTMAKWIKPLP